MKEAKQTGGGSSPDLAKLWEAYQVHSHCLDKLGELAKRSDGWPVHRFLTDRIEVQFQPGISNSIAGLSNFRSIITGPFKFKSEFVQAKYTLPYKEVFPGRDKWHRYFLNYLELGASITLDPPDSTFALTPGNVLQKLRALKGTPEIYLKFDLPLGELREGKWLKKDLEEHEGKRDDAREQLLKVILCREFRSKSGATTVADFCSGQ